MNRTTGWIVTAARGLMLAGAAAGLPALAGFGGGWIWWLELASHFRLHYAVVLAAATLGLAALRRFRWAALFLLLGAVNLGPMVPLFTGAAAPTSDRAPLRAMLANVHTSNRQHDALLEQIRAHDPDVLLLLEIDDRWVDALGELRESHPHQLVQAAPDNFGIGLFSKLPFDRAEIVLFGADRVPAIQARFLTDGRPFHLFGVHPRPPISSRYTALRDDHLRSMGDTIRALDEPVLLLGDLNATPYSAPFRDLVERSGLKDGCRGYQPTWPVFLPLMGIPIDHVLHDGGVEIARKSVLPPIGSDHRPLLVEFDLTTP